LESYAVCTTGEEVLSTQNRWLTEGGPKRPPRTMPDSDSECSGEGSESESDDGMPRLEPNRNRTDFKIGGGSRRAAFPGEMPPSESDEEESEESEESEEGEEETETEDGLSARMDAVTVGGEE